MMRHYLLDRKIVNREKYILQMCSGKKVLHIGCADWPLTETQIENGKWLHGQLSQVARECIGVDISKDAISLLSEIYGVSNIKYGDAEQLELREEDKYEVIVAGEVIEHLNNVGNFLKSMTNIMSEDSLLIISTTNAFCFRRMLGVAVGIESVHPDHVSYYSHRTLETLCKRYGLAKVESSSYAIENRKPLISYFIEKVSQIISPNLCEGIVHTYRLAK